MKLKSAEEDTELQLDADTLGVKNVCYISMKMKVQSFDRNYLASNDNSPSNSTPLIESLINVYRQQ